jgi:ligand-binding SRPBCC domain-containing protein
VKTFSFERKQYLPLDVESVFAFFSDAGNLEHLTPPWLRFHLLTLRPIEIEVGTLIDYRLRLRGVPVRWQSEITAWEPPHRFVDEQRRGPYRLWVHEHRFEPQGDGTIVTDAVTYAVSGDEVVNRLLVRPDLDRIFDYRARKLEEWALGQLDGHLEEPNGSELPSLTA